jgi:uncharacterized repeat protein (TIGR01451 family)
MSTQRSTVRLRARAAAAALAAGLAGLLAFAAVPALAITEGPQWTVTSVSAPTNFKPGDESGEDVYRVTVTNTGGAAAQGSPVVVTDELPVGLSLDPAGASGEDPLANINHPGTGGANFSCALRTCTFTGEVVPSQTLDLTFPVDVAREAPSLLTNVLRVSGGGASAASVSTPTVISETPASFGISPGGAATALSTAQAGAHPDLTTSIAFNTVNAQGSLAADPKDTVDALPPGFAGDLVDTPSCPVAKFEREECPIGTQIGVTTLTLQRKEHRDTHIEPVYNLTPSPGEVSKLGFPVVHGVILVQGSVSLRPGDYGLNATFDNINQGILELDSVSLTIWGVPSNPIHDPLRWNGGEVAVSGGFGAPSAAALAPFFTNPTACGAEPLNATFAVTSWQHPNASESPAPTNMPFGPIVGCDRLGMEPSLTAEATTDRTSAATGLVLNVGIPQTYDNADGLATSTLRKQVVTLPEGMTVNPSAGAGLAGCSPAQYAQEGVQFVAGQGCPNESKLGEVEIVTPSLAEHAKGSVFLAQPYDNPFGEPGHPNGSLLALYIVARFPNRGVLVKAPGEVRANELTGRLVTTFDTSSTPGDGLPPLPFSLLTFRFNPGETAPLVTPPACGSYQVTTEMTPYSNPDGAPLEPLIPPFPISNGVDGGPCPPGGVPPFAPAVTAGTENNDAGAYSPLNIRIARNDGEQEITGLSFQLPPGLTGNLSGIPFCSEAAIEASRHKTGAEEEAGPSCPAASEIGHSVADAGVGSLLAQAPGKLYLAGPFEGAPFSIASITSAKVGPFDLGTVVVHLPLQINPLTAQVSIPAGPDDQIPHIIKGIVIHLREIRAFVNKRDFMLNPTNCDPLNVGATVIGSGADFASAADDVPVTVGTPFRVTACQALKFAPSFKVSTSGKTSRSDGASLSVKLTVPGALGTQANIRQVKVDLPKQLPSRLTTLQKACTAAQFNSNPAGCPAASVVGHAKAITPIIPVPLEGPAYFVSHGGEAFPSLIVVLQGYGITIDLVGSTFISKAGITSSTFKTVPDQPVGSFELTLPQGPFSALAANGNLCASTKTVTVSKRVTRRIHGRTRRVTVKVKKSVAAPLAMPTAFIGQNGATIHESTPVSVTGCAKAKPAAKKKAKTHKKGKKK